MAAQKKQTVVLSWGEVRRAWLSAIRDGKMPIKGGHGFSGTLESYARNPTRIDRGFAGGSPAQTCGWIDDGYRTKEIAHSAEYAAISDQQHWTYDEEEGELDIDRVMSGYDHIFLDRETRAARPGMRLMFEYAFACGTDPKVISQYGQWCASLIQSLETSGYDLVVDIWIHLDGLFQDDYNTRTSVIIRVKEENELSSFTDWSALFAPTGYRHLGFLAKCLAAEKKGTKTTYGLGQTIGGQDWGVTYDRENQTVQVRVNQRAGAKFFPGDRLNEDALKEKLIPMPIKLS